MYVFYGIHDNERTVNKTTMTQRKHVWLTDAVFQLICTQFLSIYLINSFKLPIQNHKSDNGN